MDFKTIVAETPYDEMGKSFAETFGYFLNEYTLAEDTSFQQLSLHIFKMRLDLATQFNTFFASQVTANGHRNLWKERFSGIGNQPCYSFAMPMLARTAKFFGVCEAYHRENSASTTIRNWDESYAPRPDLPFNPTVYTGGLPMFEHSYRPRFEARSGGSFFFRWMKYGARVYLFEHPRSRWIHMLKNEAQSWWMMARDRDLPLQQRFEALASFEWVWYISNPFMRAGATTGDVLSLLVQKEMLAQELPIHIREGFYAQDCEALILPFEVYVAKRVNDLTNGHVKKFNF